MIYNIEFSQEANNDMQSVFLWIAEEKGMPQTAMNYASKMKATIREIAKHPYSYSIRTLPLSILQYGFDTRRCNFGKYAILFAIRETEKLIYIHRVIPSALLTNG
ncbi:hypothetical protein FACS189421_04750 [Bacteroidia bacterium]|nr:hypothetical protein FACS189421_04750 [Bacteroidia bacterium]GHT49313.1 hypothetical protein FACS189440_14830 [Bacteroidia bacterium]